MKIDVVIKEKGISDSFYTFYSWDDLTEVFMELEEILDSIIDEESLGHSLESLDIELEICEIHYFIKYKK